MTKKRIVITVAIVAAIGAVGYGLFAPKTPKTTYETAKAERGTLTQTVQATGEVTSSEDVELKFEASGTIRTIAAKVGAAVKAGDVLAELDARDGQLNLQKAHAATLAAQAALDKLSAGATPEDVRVTQASVTTAETDLVLAQQALADAQQALLDAKASNEAGLAKSYGDLVGSCETLFLKSSSSVQELGNDVYDAVGNIRSDFSPTDTNLATQATASYKSAKVSLAKMTVDIAALRTATDRAVIDAGALRLIDDASAIRDSAQLANAMMQSAIIVGSTSQSSLDTKRVNVKASWTDLVAAWNAASSEVQAVASTRAANTTAMNVAQAKVNSASDNVAVSTASLESAQAALALKKAPATAYDAENLRALLASAKAAENEAELALEKSKIIAPFDGTVSQILAKVGGSATPADVMLRIHGADIYEVEADVPETDVAKLTVGMDASITLDAYGTDKKFPAKLTSIDTAQTVIQDIVYYKTRFRLESPDQPVRTGMTANVNVTAAKKDGVLFIPLRSVHTRDDGSKFVKVIKGGQTRDADVTLGLRGDNNFVEAVSGISEGDEVIMATYVNGKAI